MVISEGIENVIDKHIYGHTDKHIKINQKTLSPPALLYHQRSGLIDSQYLKIHEKVYNTCKVCSRYMNIFSTLG